MLSNEKRKEVTGKFSALGVESIVRIEDQNLRKKALCLTAKEAGFTLMELLVVVAILAIIGGAAISSFGGQETKASQGTATNVIASIESNLRYYQAAESRLPDNLESLACRPLAAAGAIVNTAAPSPVVAATSYKFGGTSDISGVGGGIGLKLAGKFDLVAADAIEAGALNDAGVLNVRYAVAAACDNDAATVENAATIGGTTIAAAADFGDDAHFLVDADIPNHAFEDPRPNTAATDWENRGRGFSIAMAAGEPVMIWNRGADGYNNKKVGADANAVLIGLGIGQSSDFIGGPKSPYAKAPFYGQIGKDKYAHYIALINVGTDGDADGRLATAPPVDAPLSDGNAYIQAIIDARGDFLDEEVSEFSGQKS